MVDSLSHKLEQTKDYEGQIEVLLHLTRETRQSDLKKSLKYCSQGEKLSNKKKDKLNTAKFKLEKGTTHYYLGNYKETIANYFEANSIFKELKDYPYTIKCQINMGALYDRIADYNEAIKYYKRTIEYYNSGTKKEKEDYAHDLTRIYNNIASAYEKLGETDKAIYYYSLGLKEAKRINYRIIIASISNNLGKIESASGNFDKAREYLNSAIKIRKEDNNLKGLAKSYYFLSNHFSNTGELDSAKWAAEKSLVISTELNLLEPQQIAHFFLYEYYEQIGEYKTALNEHKIYKQISDSLINEEKINELSKLKTQNEIQQLEERAKIEKERIKRQYIIFIIALSASLAFAILIVFLLRIKKKKVELEKYQLQSEIETKNKELTTKIMYLVQKNEFINSVAKSLLIVKDRLTAENKTPIQQIIYNIQSQSDKDIWNEFEHRFNLVHNDFYITLRKKHPDITPAEERLCALLRLNLSSKEISSITHQTIRSIEVARGRLRKKLHLTGMDINLVSYLSEF